MNWHETVEYRQVISRFTILIFLMISTVPVYTQTNLLLNPNADIDSKHWRTSGKVTIEEFDGGAVFVVRSEVNVPSQLVQEVDLTETDIGKYALFIGRGSSERVNPDGAITGLPYLYGYMLSSKRSNGITIIEYLQGQNMLARPSISDEWVTMYGIFKVPPGTIAIRYFLNQAERNGVPPNGSAARFDNLGLYLFKTEKQALDFARSYN